MPHVDQGRRKRYAKLVKQMVVISRHTESGDLAFVIAQLINRFVGFSPDFERHNAVVGVLDNIKDEFKRLSLWPYEDRKIKDNGRAL